MKSLDITFQRTYLRKICKRNIVRHPAKLSNILDLRKNSLLKKKNYVGTVWLKYCPSKVNWRIPNRNKKHHTSLHESTQITTQANQKTASKNLNNNNLEKNTFLQIIPITIETVPNISK